MILLFSISSVMISIYPLGGCSMNLASELQCSTRHSNINMMILIIIIFIKIIIIVYSSINIISCVCLYVK